MYTAKGLLGLKFVMTNHLKKVTNALKTRKEKALFLEEKLSFLGKYTQ